MSCLMLSCVCCRQVDGKTPDNMKKRVGDLRAELEEKLGRDRARQLIPTAREVRSHAN